MFQMYLFALIVLQPSDGFSTGGRNPAFTKPHPVAHFSMLPPPVPSKSALSSPNSETEETAVDSHPAMALEWLCAVLSSDDYSRKRSRGGRNNLEEDEIREFLFEKKIVSVQDLAKKSNELVELLERQLAKAPRDKLIQQIKGLGGGQESQPLDINNCARTREMAYYHLRKKSKDMLKADSSGGPISNAKTRLNAVFEEAIKHENVNDFANAMLRKWKDGDLADKSPALFLSGLNDEQREEKASEVLDLIVNSVDKNLIDDERPLRIVVETDHADQSPTAFRFDPNGFKNDQLKASIKRGMENGYLGLTFLVAKSGHMVIFDDEEPIDFVKIKEKLTALGVNSNTLKEQLDERIQALVESKNPVKYVQSLAKIAGAPDTFGISTDKKQAIVIAGESGSGKTRYAVEMARTKRVGNQRYDVAIYAAIDETFDDTIPSTDSLCLDLQRWVIGLRDIVLASAGEILKPETKDSIVGKVDSYLLPLNEAPYKWAETQLSNLFREHGIGTEQTDKFGRLLVVIDEIGRAPKFASALVSMIREIQSKEPFKNIARQVDLVLCGAGSEYAVRHQKGTTESIGTDPRKYYLTSVGSVDVNNVEKLLRAMSDSEDAKDNDWIVLTDDAIELLTGVIKEGIRTRVLSQNARMLCDGIVPLLRGRCILFDMRELNLEELKKKRAVLLHRDISNMLRSANLEKKSQLSKDRMKKRLIDFQNCGVAMDYVVWRYTTLNGLKDVCFEDQVVLKNAGFQYMLKHSLGQLSNASGDLLKLFPATNRMNEKLKVDEDEKRILFNYGICIEDPAQTSDALRYYLCDGRVLPVSPGEGLAFESVVTNHHRRFYESAGNDVAEMTLSAEYPSSTSTASINSRYLRFEAEMNSTLEQEGWTDDENHKKEAEINDFLRQELSKIRDETAREQSKPIAVQIAAQWNKLVNAVAMTTGNKDCNAEKVALIIHQPPENKAPGPDSMVLRFSGNEFVLECYQHKHYGLSSEVNTTKVQRSLFIGESGKPFEDMLAASLKKELGSEVTIQRYLQLSQSAASMVTKDGTELKKQYLGEKENGYEVLPREAIEPTMTLCETMGLKDPEVYG